MEGMFKPDTKTIYDLFSSDATALVIPEFQRSYSWNEENIEDFFEDIISSLSAVDLDTDKVEQTKTLDQAFFKSFLGAVILTENGSQYKNNHTDCSFTAEQIIDGQQRLSTMMFVAVIFYFKFLALEKEHGSEVENKNLMREINNIKGDISKLFIKKVSNEIAPRIIRLETDFWSDDEHKKKYSSDIAKPCYEAILEINKLSESNLSTDFNKIIKSIIENSANHVKPSLKRINEILDKYIKGENELYNVDSKVIESIMLGMNITTSKPIEICRAIALAKFFLTGIILTVIRTDTRYAYTIFDALNTSGQPLTVIDTFFAKVKTELSSVNDDNVKKEINNYINEIRNTYNEYQAQEDVKRLITTFALTYYSEKLLFKPRMQRNFLNNKYNIADGLNNKHQFILNLHNTFLIYRDFFFKYNANEKIYASIDEYKFAFFAIDKLSIELLVHGNPIAFSTLVKFYAKLAVFDDDKSKASNVQDKNKALNEFCECLRAVAAFSCLYRLYYKKTNQIDNHFRILMSDVFYNKDACSMRQDCSPSKVREKLKEILDNHQLLDKEYWIKQVKNNNLYKDAKHFTRFILLILRNSSAILPDNLIEEDANYPFLGHAHDGKNFFAVDENLKFSNYTIEHVAPQNRENWKEKKYNLIYNNSQTNLPFRDDEDSPLNSLGNMIIIPQNLNNDLKNKSFEDKISAIKSNYCGTKEEYDRLAQDGEVSEVHFNIPRELSYEQLLWVYKHKQQYNWDYDFVTKRSENMARLAHECLTCLFNNDINKIYN